MPVPTAPNSGKLSISFVYIVLFLLLLMLLVLLVLLVKQFLYSTCESLSLFLLFRFQGQGWIESIWHSVHCHPALQRIFKFFRKWWQSAVTSLLLLLFAMLFTLNLFLTEVKLKGLSKFHPIHHQCCFRGG